MCNFDIDRQLQQMLIAGAWSRTLQAPSLQAATCYTCSEGSTCCHSCDAMAVQEEAAARQALVAMRAELGQERAANEQRWTGLQAAQDRMIDLKVHSRMQPLNTGCA